jgi:hypothetical protein
MRRLLAIALVTCLAPAAMANDKPSYALFRLDPLGIEPEIVEQLARILRVELERVLGQQMPSRAAVEQVAASNKKLAGCTADPACLAPLAKLLKSTRIIAGNVGGLSDNYVVNLKLVDAEGKELRRVTATLHGRPDELIEEIRVAAFRLVAPEKMTGAIAVLSDVPGAVVNLDGLDVGLTPLAAPLSKVLEGTHKVKVTREGFSTFEEDVPVRFEKTTQVVVRQSATSEKARRAMRRAGQTPFYSKWWFWTAVSVAAVGVGIGIGFGIPKQSPIDCARAMCP